MNEQSITLLACMAVIALLAVLLYRAANRPERNDPVASPDLNYISGVVAQVLAHVQNTDMALSQHRRVLNDAHKRICAVTNGVGKPLP